MSLKKDLVIWLKNFAKKNGLYEQDVVEFPDGAIDYPEEWNQLIDSAGGNPVRHEVARWNGTIYGETPYRDDLLHGTTHEIPVSGFNLNNATTNNDWGAATYASNSPDDVAENYAGIGPDLTRRLQAEEEAIQDAWFTDSGSFADEIEKYNLDPDDDIPEDILIEMALARVKGGSDGITYPLKIDTSNYVIYGGEDATKLDMKPFSEYEDEARQNIDRAEYSSDESYENDVYFEAESLQDQDSDSPINKVYEAMIDAGMHQDDAVTVLDSVREGAEDGIYLSDIDYALRNSQINEVYDASDEVLHPGAISAKVFQNLGYEGIVDNTVNSKFGSRRKYGRGMAGMDDETEHIITFGGAENNIRLKDSPGDPLPRKRLSKNLTNSIGAAGVLGALGLGASEESEAGVMSNLVTTGNLVRKGFLKAEHIENKSLSGKAAKAYQRKFETDPDFRLEELSEQFPDLEQQYIEPFDLRFDGFSSPRKGEIPNILNTTVQLENRQMLPGKGFDIEDFEGYPYVVTQSDRTRAGSDILGINGVMYDDPVNMPGGQGFMFDPQFGGEQVWSSAPGAVGGILNMANEVWQPGMPYPLLLPTRMTPRGSDFATMSSEVVLAHARANMSASDARRADKQIRAIFPKWKGIKNPESTQQLYEMTGAQRKGVDSNKDKGIKAEDGFLTIMDRDYRDKGSLGIGQVRVAIADPKQLNAPDHYLQNIGQIDMSGQRIPNSGHPTYPIGVPGKGLGWFNDDNISPLDLNPKFAKEKGVLDILIPQNKKEKADLRKAQRSFEVGNQNASKGFISEDVIKNVKTNQEKRKKLEAYIRELNLDEL